MHRQSETDTSDTSYNMMQATSLEIIMSNNVGSGVQKIVNMILKDQIWGILKGPECAKAHRSKTMCI
jgi:hypothetical protein